MHGNTLLETVFALWLLGTTAWAAVHTHLSMRDAAHAFQLRSQALQLLEATAQAVESGEAILNVQRRAQRHATKQLPDGRVVIKTRSTMASPNGYPTRPLFWIEVLWDTRVSKPISPDAIPLKPHAISSNANESSHWSRSPQGGARSICVVVAQ
jgi:type II secretory pathway pseudopilin PulG